MKSQEAALKQEGSDALLDHDKEAVRNHLLEAETLVYQAQQELTTLIRELRPLMLQNN